MWFYGCRVRGGFRLGFGGIEGPRATTGLPADAVCVWWKPILAVGQVRDGNVFLQHKADADCWRNGSWGR